MRARNILLSLLAFGAGWPACAPAGAAAFYGATSPRTYPGDALSYYYNPGPANGGEAGHILFDDVTVMSPFPGTLFNVKKVTYKITRKAGAPAVAFSPYYAALFADPVPNSPARGGPGDLGAYDPLSPNQFASALQLPAYTGTQTMEQIITFGDGVHTLFNVSGAVAGTDTRYRSFAIGLKISTTGPENGWTLSQNLQNMDLLWDHKDNAHFAEFTYGFDDSDGTVIGTQYLAVEGLVLSGVPGDATGDGQVDARDLLQLAMHWDQSGDYTMGDFNFDTVVNSADLAMLTNHWQRAPEGLTHIIAALGLPEASDAPEPTGPAMLLPGLLRLIQRHRRRPGVTSPRLSRRGDRT